MGVGCHLFGSGQTPLSKTLDVLWPTVGFPGYRGKWQEMKTILIVTMLTAPVLAPWSHAAKIKA